MENEYQFLDLSNLNDADKNELKNILKLPGVLKLPWVDAVETEYEHNEEQVQISPGFYDSGYNPAKYDSSAEMVPTIYPPMHTSQYPGDYMQLNPWSMPYQQIPNVPYYMPPHHFHPSMYMTGRNEAQELQSVPPSQSPMNRGMDKRNMRGRGGKRNDGYNNRVMNHCSDMQMNYAQDPNTYIPYQQQSMFYNQMPQHPGQSVYYSPHWPHPLPSPNPHDYQVYTPTNNNNNNNNVNSKYGRQSHVNGESMISSRGNNMYMKDRNRIKPIRYDLELPARVPAIIKEENKSSQTNIHTTVTVKTSNEENNSTTQVNKKAVNSIETQSNKVTQFKIKHSIVSTKNDTVYSSVEVKQDEEQVVIEKENEEEVEDKVPVKEKEKEPEVVESEVEPVVEEKLAIVEKEEKAVKKQIKVTEDVPVPVAVTIPVVAATTPVVAATTPVVAVTTPVVTVTTPVVPVMTPVVVEPPVVNPAPTHSWANVVGKRKSTDGSTSPMSSRPIARIDPINVVAPSNNVESSVGGTKYKVENDARKSSPQGQHTAFPKLPLSNSLLKEMENNGVSDVSGNECPLDDPVNQILGEFLQKHQMEKQTVSLLPRGLTNRSNYCYINSILQALLACPPFYNLLVALPYQKTSSRKNSISPLIDNMVKFVHEFTPLADGARLTTRKDRNQKRNDDAMVDIQSGVPFEPLYVYTMFKNNASAGAFLEEGRQQDAEEFLSFLLNGISEEMLKLMKLAEDKEKENVEKSFNGHGPNHSQNEEEWTVMGPKNKGSITRSTEVEHTPLSEIFMGKLRSTVTRGSGGQSTDNVQPFVTLQLDIEKVNSVTDALDILVGKDQVEGMTDSKTKQQIEAWKQVSLEELPVILILHLKWFDYKIDGCSKIVKNMEFPINLKIDRKIISQHALKKYDARQRQYKLFAVTYHDGKEATKGHYVTDAFHVGFGCWVRYDDSSLKSVTEPNVLNPLPPRVPYLLYYRRSDTIGYNQTNAPKSR